MTVSSLDFLLSLLSSRSPYFVCWLKVPHDFLLGSCLLYLYIFFLGVICSGESLIFTFNSDLSSCSPIFLPAWWLSYTECLRFTSHLACPRGTSSAKSAPPVVYLLVGCSWQHLGLPFMCFSCSLFWMSLQLYLNSVPPALIQAHITTNSFSAGCNCRLLCYIKPIYFLTFIVSYLTFGLFHDQAPFYLFRSLSLYFLSSVSYAPCPIWTLNISNMQTSSLSF